MNDFFKWLSKVGLQGIIWVFILSISWNGQTVFQHAHEIFVQNALVRTIDEELAGLWVKVAKMARATFTKSEREKTEAL